jgi:hypothetical protein
LLSLCLWVPPNVARQCLGKHFTAATNTHASIRDCWTRCFLCGPHVMKRSVYIEKKVGDYFSELHDSQSNQTEGCESRGTRNQEWLCWRGPAAIYQTHPTTFVLPKTSCNIILLYVYDYLIFVLLDKAEALNGPPVLESDAG